NAISLVHETGRPIRIDDHVAAREGPADVPSDGACRSAIGAPITIDGRLWGAISMEFTPDEPPPPDAETRLAAFTELLATAIANTNARAALRGFAQEQAGLRRVATLVARAATPEEVFAAIAEEAGRLLGAHHAWMTRYEPDGAARLVATWSSTGAAVPAETRLSPGGRNVYTLVFQTGRPARIDGSTGTSGPDCEVASELGVRAAVG